jgi:hypothetical protein
MSQKTFVSILRDFCKLVGFKDVDSLARGAKLKVDNYVVSFVWHDKAPQDCVGVYIDLGPLIGEPAVGLRSLMELNFMLSTAGRSMICLHPVTHNIFLTFRYMLLEESASGQDLLDTMLRSISELGKEMQVLTESAG